jgi:hypothetical protein
MYVVAIFALARPRLFSGAASILEIADLPHGNSDIRL